MVKISQLIRWIIILILMLESAQRALSMMSLEDMEKLRKQVAVNDHDSPIKRFGISPHKESDEEKRADIPDSLPLVESFSKAENSLAEVLDANRITGVEPFEGDILLDRTDKENIDEGTSGVATGSRRQMQRSKEKLWQSRVIPYEIDSSRASERPQIEKAMRDIEAVSCLKFRPKKFDDKHWIWIYFGKGCYSDIGRKAYGGKTSLSLGHSCIKNSLIIHELMHAIGFFHEQSRPDRDSFIKIYFENIRGGMEENFEKYKSYEADEMDTDYDFHSIMQYGNTAFTVNAKNTMEDIFDVNMELGSKNLSKTDIIRLNKAYQCHVTGKLWSEWSDWSPCFKTYKWNMECKRERQKYCFSEDKSKCEGANEYGVKNEDQPCDSCDEKIAGHWGHWSSWSSCSTTCDEGQHVRTRKCNNPEPKNGGKPCKGKETEKKYCRITRCDSKWYDTNFEDDWGMWEQGTKDDFDWERRQGETPTLRTGPNGDHTFKNGYYVYIEGSPPRIPFEVARLISRQIPSGFGAKCFTFFYFMKGKHIGYLDLHLKTASGSFINLWRKNSHQGPDWYNGAVNLPALNEPYRIVFEGQRGIGELSDIAIDDIFIDDGKCPLEDQGCSDHNPTCADWAITGECEKNKGWMMSHCCKACAEEMKCGNKDIKCIIWAKAKQCDLNKDWMWKNCCRSCRQVLDQHPKCKLWAKQGECEKNKHWMKRNCRGSCGMWTL